MRLIRSLAWTAVGVCGCWSSLPMHARELADIEQGKPFDPAPADWPSRVMDEVGARIDESSVKHVLSVRPGEPRDAKAGVFPTIRAAMDAATPMLDAGEPVKITLAPGVYRETLGIRRQSDVAAQTLLILEGAGPDQTVWTGADVYEPTRWHDLGDGLYVTDWSEQWGHWAYWWEADKPIGHRSEMVFVNGELMRQTLLEVYRYGGEGLQILKRNKDNHTWDYETTLDAQEALQPGTYGVTERPENGGKLYLRLPAGVSMQDAHVEVSARRQAFAMFPKSVEFKDGGRQNTVVRGIGFEKFASRTQGRGYEDVTTFGSKPSNVLIEDCRFQWNNGQGLNVRGHDWTLRRVNSNYNGFSGISGECDGLLMEDTATNFNNWRGHWAGNRGWWLGGTKLHQCVKAVLINHQSVGNLAPGLWFDIHNHQIKIDHPVVALNEGFGMFLELSQGPFQVNRGIIAKNELRDVYVLVTGQTEINDTIIYRDRMSRMKGNDSDKFHDALSVAFHLRKGTHAQQRTITPTLYSVNRSVVMGSAEQPTVARLLNWTITSHPYFDLYNADFDRVVYASPSGGSDRFGFYKQDAGILDGKTIDEWRELTQDPHAQWMSDPGFNDPSRLDFTLRPDAPLREVSGMENLPTIRLDPALIDEARRFKQWAGYDTGQDEQVNAVDPNE